MTEARVKSDVSQIRLRALRQSLGPFVVFGFAKQCGGEVLVDSAPGQGPIFTVYLPRAAAEGMIETRAGRESVAFKGLCILLVEDNPDVNEFAASALSEMGHFTIRAPSGEKALAKFLPPPGVAI